MRTVADTPGPIVGSWFFFRLLLELSLPPPAVAHSPAEFPEHLSIRPFSILFAHLSGVSDDHPSCG